MSGYDVLVFVHVSGAIVLFVAWGIEAAALQQLRAARSTDHANIALTLRRRSLAIAPAGMLTAAGTGIAMMAERWGMQAWMTAALVGLLAIIALSLVLERRAAPAMAAMLRSTHPSPLALRTASAAAVTSLALRAGLGMAILALMTSKPGVSGSSVALIAGLTMGAIAAWWLNRRGLGVWRADATEGIAVGAGDTPEQGGRAGPPS